MFEPKTPPTEPPSPQDAIPIDPTELSILQDSRFQGHHPKVSVFQNPGGGGGSPYSSAPPTGDANYSIVNPPLPSPSLSSSSPIGARFRPLPATIRSVAASAEWRDAEVQDLEILKSGKSSATTAAPKAWSPPALWESGLGEAGALSRELEKMEVAITLTLTTPTPTLTLTLTLIGGEQDGSIRLQEGKF